MDISTIDTSVLFTNPGSGRPQKGLLAATVASIG